jgi:hypothetical protein
MEPNNFFGAVVNDNWTLSVECPVECRPKDHPGANPIKLFMAVILQIFIIS